MRNLTAYIVRGGRQTFRVFFMGSRVIEDELHDALYGAGLQAERVLPMISWLHNAVSSWPCEAPVQPCPTADPSFPRDETTVFRAVIKTYRLQAVCGTLLAPPLL